VGTSLTEATWTNAWREEFRDALIVAGFTRALTTEVERWDGTVEVGWEEPTTGRRQWTIHQIGVELPEAFPFAAPIVRPTDLSTLPGSPHLMQEGGDLALCLWVDGQNGWRPWTRADAVLARVDTWYRHAHQDDWNIEQRPPDLHLFFAPGGPVHLMITGEDWPPPSDASAGRFGLWRKNEHALLAGSPTHRIGVMPAKEPPARERLSFASWATTATNGAGYWFRLKHQPRPAKTLGKLFVRIDVARGLPPGTTIQELRAGEADKVAPGRERLFFALGYTDGHGEEHWLFVYADRTAFRRNWRSAESLQTTKVHGASSAPATRDALLRRTGHTARGLDGARVAIFGVGALGSVLAVWLAKAGVPALSLVDGDRLRPGNLVRHAAGLFWIGHRKTVATAYVVNEHVPDCAVASYPATWDADYLRHIIDDTAVVVDTTAVPAFSLLLNDVCVALGKPLVTAAGFRRAQIGRVRIVRPGKDACVMCYEGGYIPDKGLYPAIPVGDEGTFFETGCGVPTVEATAIDADAITNVVARSVLRLLRERPSPGVAPDPRNHALIVNVAVPNAPAPFDEEGLHWTHWTPRPDCVVCHGATRSPLAAPESITDADVEGNA
jgi:molybdopterin/thiamine biosynthesis adenylyltransferase